MRFTGLAAHEAIPGHVGAFDIEYMAAGRAIITPDQPNLREVLRDGETALLFDRTEEGAMWPAVLRLLEDRALRRRLVMAARREVLTRDLTWAGNTRRVAALARGDITVPFRALPAA